MTQKILPNTSKAPAGKVSCLLCGGFISVSGGDRARFVDHMSNEHDAKTDCHEVLLAACVLDAREKGFLVKTTSTRLDAIGRGKTPNYSDSFVTKLTATLPTNEKVLPAASQRLQPRRRDVQRSAPAPLTNRTIQRQGRVARVPVPRSVPRPAPVQRSVTRPAPIPTNPPISSVLRGNSSISFSKVDMRRKCNICSISLPNPSALVQHMNRNHFNLPGGINIVSGSGETIAGSSSSPSRRPNPVSPSVQKVVNNLRKVEPKSKVIDRSKLTVHKLSPQRNKEKSTNKLSALKNSGIVIEKVADAMVTDNDEILVMEEDPLNTQDTVTNSDYECNICNKKLASSADLKLHRNELHGEDNPPEDPTQEKLRDEIDKLETLELLDNLVNFLDE